MTSAARNPSGFPALPTVGILTGDFPSQLPQLNSSKDVSPGTRKTGGHKPFRVCDLRSVRFVNRSLCGDHEHSSPTENPRPFPNASPETPENKSLL